MASPGTRLELKLLEVRLEYLRFANSEAAQMAETTSKTQQELQRIEQQIEQLEAAAGDNSEARRQLHDLHGRVETLRSQMGSHLEAWVKTELARHPQRPYF